MKCLLFENAHNPVNPFHENEMKVSFVYFVLFCFCFCFFLLLILNDRHCMYPKFHSQIIESSYDTIGKNKKN
jgi:hypothetical protein